ncbi:MAG: hypothetical protein V1775_12295 [Bacteroidota bacterium]
MKSNKIIARLLIVLAFLSLNGQLSAQNRISSPYSMFGIGDLLTNNGVYNMAMGGISYGIYSPYFVNTSNPATYAAFDSLSFIFDVGAHTRQSKLITQDLTQTANHTSLGNLLFGFPVSRSWKSSFGLMPYSMVGYKMLDSRIDDAAGKVNFLYEGSGGVNQAYIGNSIALNKHFSIGFNFSYLFGTIYKTKADEFPDSIFKLNYKVISTAKVHDIYLNYGILYHNQRKTGLHYSAGLVFSNSSKISVSENKLSYLYYKSSTGIDIPTDTILNESTVKGNLRLPMNLGAGFTLGKNDKWLVGADIQWQQWEKYSYFGTPDLLKNSMRVSLGGSFTPSVSTVSSYFQRITYRGGGRYTKSYLELEGKGINEFGISLGIGLPLPRTRSTINLAAEFGSRGTISNNLIKESFVKFTLGLSIFERWFIIRKYD